VLGAERGHALLAQPRGRRWGRVAGKERQGDLAFDVGEHRHRAGPEGVQGRGELVGRGHARLHQVASGAHHRAQRAGLGRERRKGAQPVAAQPQVLGDHHGVAGVGLGARQDLGVAPGLDRVGGDRDHRVAGLEQPVDQAAVGPLDRDGQPGWLPETAQPADELREPVGGVGDLEGGHPRAGLVEHAHGVAFGRPVDSDEHVCSLWWQRQFGDEDAGRVVTDWRSTARPSVAGGRSSGSWGRQCHADPRGVTAQGRHPSPHRSQTTKTMPALVNRRVDQ